jgi:hypothetical protein
MATKEQWTVTRRINLSRKTKGSMAFHDHFTDHHSSARERNASKRKRPVDRTIRLFLTILGGICLPLAHDLSRARAVET